MPTNGKSQSSRSGRNSPKNPPWSRDEATLLLDLYKRVGFAAASHPDVRALSGELNERARANGDTPLANFRNPAGVAMRLRNLGRHDPVRDRDRGLRPGGAIDQQVWHEFAEGAEKLAREVRRIRADGLSSGEYSRTIRNPRRRMAAEDFHPVTAEHLLRAATLLADGFDDHPFHDSTNYDVAFQEKRLSPKAMFGIAASLALGREVGPQDFSGGLGTICFRSIAAAGYPIITKGTPLPGGDPLSSDDRQWTEGNKILKTHLARERATGLASAKKAQFRSTYGKLYCEQCGLDPVAQFGRPEGEACIEVHHREIAVSHMVAGHLTNLSDLQCLCANCHRVVHRLAKLSIIADNSTTADRMRKASHDG